MLKIAAMIAKIPPAVDFPGLISTTRERMIKHGNLPQTGSFRKQLVMRTLPFISGSTTEPCGYSIIRLQVTVGVFVNGSSSTRENNALSFFCLLTIQ